MLGNWMHWFNCNSFLDEPNWRALPGVDYEIAWSIFPRLGTPQVVISFFPDSYLHEICRILLCSKAPTFCSHLVIT